MRQYNKTFFQYRLVLPSLSVYFFPPKYQSTHDKRITRNLIVYAFREALQNVCMKYYKMKTTLNAQK